MPGRTRRISLRVAFVLPVLLSSGCTIRDTAPPTDRLRERDCSVDVVPAQHNLNRELETAGTGATVCFAPGTYRLTTPLKPLNGQTLVSTEPREAILNGSALIPASQMEQSGSFWVISGQTQQGPIYNVDQYTNTCAPAEYQGCKYPEQVFLDDESLWQVTSLPELSSGEFYFDYTADKVYLADNPNGRKLEIGIGAGALAPGGTNVTVVGLVVERFNTPASGAAVYTGTDWKVLNCEVRYNNGGGTWSADGSLLKDSYVHHNGQAGTFGDGQDAVLDGVEVAFNGINGYNTNWEGGGSKFAGSVGLTIRNSYYHDNLGAGIWLDIDNINTVIDGNRVVDNADHGIVLEIGYKATVRNNLVTGNGNVRTSPGAFGAGILVVNNRDVEVYGNTVLDNWAGITAVQQPRGSGTYGLRETANLYVHDNTIRVADGLLAAGLEALDCSCSEYFDSKNNRWQGNDYLQPASQDSFAWNDLLHDFTAWQALGMDTGGTAG